MNEELAVPRPVIAPSDVEREACERLATISTDGVEARAKKLKEAATLSGLPTEPTEVPEFIRRSNASQQLKIQQTIDELKAGRE